MRDEFFASLEVILHTSEIQKRFELFDELYQKMPDLSFDHSSSIYPITQPIYQEICKIIHPTKIQRSKSIHSDCAMAAFLHSIAHIEYSAIDLALDASYRFRNLPSEFYRDWIEVAREEITHFKMLRALLQSLGYDYGDFAVHSNLFDAMKATPNFADRMALVHRGMEANGLDANPFVVQKVERSLHPLKDQILEVLAVILRDEISHVARGDRWWRFSKDPRKFEEILRLYAYSLPKVLNIDARLQCGFSLEELDRLRAYALHSRSTL
ncbi:ferritin-like domain-containing protein [Helicobacter pametensis]|uniref:ferritin-like domain-containing protein n=1 Tax=Helicobacter pametensis TaxID=95149 RepID=UPI00047F75FE|nr:ferritin-like domain-containing protein [Helicobacter pametensis]